MHGTTIMIPSAMRGDPDLTVTVIPDGTDPHIAGKPRYTWSVSDGTHTLSGGDLCGWGEPEDMVRALCGFLSNDIELWESATRDRRETTREGDPLPSYDARDREFLTQHADTLSLGSIEAD